MRLAFLRLQKKNATPASASSTKGIATPAPIAAEFDFFFGVSSATAGGEVDALAAGTEVVAAAVDVDVDDAIVDDAVNASPIIVIVEISSGKENVSKLDAQSQLSPQQNEFGFVWLQL